MINWILSQLLLVSVVLVLLLLIEAKLHKTLGAKIVYRLWLLLPLALIVNNLPQNIVAVSEQPIYRYIVNLKAYTPTIEQNDVWFMLWSIGTLVILAISAFTQWKFSSYSTTAYKKEQLSYPLPTNLNVYTHANICGPVLSGIIRPKLFLPSNFNQTFSKQQQVLILQHELTHYKRGDNWFNLLAIITVATFWFNPLLWLAYKAFRRSQELACDAVVLQNKNKEQKISYSKALLQCAPQPLSSFAIYSPYSEKKSMLKRIENIRNYSKIKPAMVGLSIVLSSTMLGGIAIAGMAEKTTSQSEINMAKPVIRIEPKYPIQAAKSKQEGSVILEFDINKDGSTDNIKVVDAFPDGVFDKVSITALKQWQYKPRIQGGIAQKQTGLKVQLDFRMDKPYKGQTAANSTIEKIKVTL